MSEKERRRVVTALYGLLDPLSPSAEDISSGYLAELAAQQIRAMSDDYARLLCDWREQDDVLQKIALLVGDEHVTGPADVLKAVRRIVAPSTVMDTAKSSDARPTDPETGKASGSATDRDALTVTTTPGVGRDHR